MSDPLDSEFVKHVLKYRPDSVTARLAVEVAELRARVEEMRKQEEKNRPWVGVGSVDE